MTMLTQASTQWASRPHDERYTSLIDMRDHFETIRAQSRELVTSNRSFAAVPTADNQGLMIESKNGHQYAPTHWAFGQLATLADAPAGYLRTLPAPIAADCINYGLQYKRNVEDVGLLLQKNGDNILRAATGPRYGRIWNADIVTGLINRFGDGITGDFRVPGEFGRDVVVDRNNTTLFAGDRDMFVFLADEKHRIDVPNRRNGKTGSMARGFFIWNSEVGDKTFGLATFLFDYVCCNRIVWGAAEFKQVTIRHTAGAPDRWAEEMAPAIEAYANGSARTVTAAIAHAREARLDKVDDFLAQRFGKRMVPVLNSIHMSEEDRPIETLWDVTTAVTAYARSVPFQSDRVDLERQAGDIMAMAA